MIGLFVVIVVIGACDSQRESNGQKQCKGGGNEATVRISATYHGRLDEKKQSYSLRISVGCWN